MSKNKKYFYLSVTFILLTSLSSLVIYRSFFNKTYTHYKIGCELYNLDFKIVHKFMGYDCLFLNDGSYVSVTKTNLYYFDRSSQLLWSKDFESHHYLELSSDQKKFYVLGNEYHLFRGDNVRFDSITSFDIKSGKLISRWSSFPVAEKLEALAGWRYDKLAQKASWKFNPTGVKYDFLHFNSIAKIPKNKLASEMPELAEGNLIVSAGVSLALFFDSQLNLINMRSIDNLQGISFHDLQITEKGELLIYHNFSKRNNNFLGTTIELINLKNNSIIWQYPPLNSKIALNSICCGGVQLLEDEKILFSDSTHGGAFYEIDRKGNVYFNKSYPEIDSNTKLPKIFMKIRKVNLTDFFKNRKGLDFKSN